MTEEFTGMIKDVYEAAKESHTSITIGTKSYEIRVKDDAAAVFGIVSATLEYYVNESTDREDDWHNNQALRLCLFDTISMYLK